MIQTDLVEVIWNMVTGAGLVIVAMNFRDKWLDYRASRSSVLASLRFLGKRKIQREAIKVAMIGMLWLTGVGSLFRPQSPEPYTMGRIILVGFLITAAILITIESLLDADQDTKVVELQREERKHAS